MKEYMVEEIRILEIVGKHQNIIELLDNFQTEETLYCVMEV